MPMNPDHAAETFVRSLQPKTPEEEAYADFLEMALRGFYRFGPELRRGYAEPIDGAGRRIKAFLDSLTDQQCQEAGELVQDSIRYALSEILFTFKQMEVRNRAGVQLELENGLRCDAHLEWLELTYPTRVRPASLEAPRDLAYIKHIERENGRQYLAPIIGQEPTERFLATRTWRPSVEMVSVAEVEEWEETVGFVSLSLKKSELADAEVTAIHVLRFFQGRSLGKKLLGAAAEATRENGAQSLVLWTLADNAYTVGFCRKRGGEEVAEREAAYATGFRELAFRWTDLEALQKQGEL